MNSNITKKLAGKVALVTGGFQGCRRLLRRPCSAQQYGDMKLCRREFIKATGAVAVLGKGLAWGAEAKAAATAEPAKLARLFPGCCAYSFQKQLAAKQMTMEQFIRKG